MAIAVSQRILLGLAVVSFSLWSTLAFLPTTNPRCRPTSLVLSEMKRPFLDQLATTLFNLEQNRVEASTEVDDKGRVGEPMEWSEKASFANQLSEFMAGPGYAFKQFVADIVAGEYDEEATQLRVDRFVDENPVAMFSFTTCPFCRRAKDYLEENNIPYLAMELDELDGNAGNEIRAVLGKKTKRTSVPAIFVGGEFIGGCNDGPGLLTLADQGRLDGMVQAALQVK